MKESARTIDKSICLKKGFHPKRQIAYGSFKTIPNPLRQLPVKPPHPKGGASRSKI